MKHILLSIFSLFTLAAVAQNVAVTPNPFVQTFQFDLSDEFSEGVAHTVIANNGTSNASLKWTIKVIDAPMGWKFFLCDKNACYGSTTVTNVGGTLNEPVNLAAGEAGSIFDLHFRPVGVAGTANVEVEIESTTNLGTVIHTAVYELTADGVSSTYDYYNSGVKVFPNPASDNFSITSTTRVDRVELYNVVGRKIKTYNGVSNGSYSLAGMPNGVYMVRLVNNDKGVIRTVRLSKRSIRP